MARGVRPARSPPPAPSEPTAGRPRLAFELAWDVDDDEKRSDAGSGYVPSVLGRRLERASLSELTPLVRRAAASADWLESAEATDVPGKLAWACEDFRPRSLRKAHALLWLALQCANVVLQLALLQEVDANLELFGATLQANCAEEHQGPGGLCVGPGWSSVLNQVFTFAPSAAEPDAADFVVPLSQSLAAFQTTSQPATFLVSVEPLAPVLDVAWSLHLATDQHNAWVDDSAVISGEGLVHKVVVARSARGPTQWAGDVSLRRGESLEARLRVAVVDSRIGHLEDIHSQRQCSFEQSWTKFSDKFSGAHPRALRLTQLGGKVVLVVSAMVVICLGLRLCAGTATGNFVGRLVGLKFLCCDMLQQVFIVSYLYGWYAKNGLRCQLCLFHPAHCDQQEPLHGGTFWLCVITALSSASFQLLIKAKTGSGIFDDADDLISSWFLLFVLRFALFSVSVLPFSVAVYLSPFWFHLEHVLALLFGAAIPLITGIATLCCGWIFIVFKDEFDGL